MGDGKAGPGAGGQQRPDQSGCGLMESSPLSLGATSAEEDIHSAQEREPCERGAAPTRDRVSWNSLLLGPSQSTQ